MSHSKRSHLKDSGMRVMQGSSPPTSLMAQQQQQQQQPYMHQQHMSYPAPYPSYPPHSQVSMTPPHPHAPPSHSFAPAAAAFVPSHGYMAPAAHGHAQFVPSHPSQQPTSYPPAFIPSHMPPSSVAPSYSPPSYAPAPAPHSQVYTLPQHHDAHTPNTQHHKMPPSPLRPITHPMSQFTQHTPNQLPRANSHQKRELLPSNTPFNGADARSSRMQVCVRVRPLLMHEQPPEIMSYPSPRSLSLLVPSKQSKEMVEREFHFDVVLPPHSTQEDVFLASGVTDYVNAALDGYASTVLAYGQTGSGKTYTMSGYSEHQSSAHKTHSPHTHGIIPRAVTYLLQQLEAAPRTWVLKCSYVEIYNETIRDLLNPSSGSLSIRQQFDSSFYVEGALCVQCFNLSEIMECINEGHKNRVVRSHALNADSSRSHAVLILQVDREKERREETKQRASTQEDEASNMNYGKLIFCDLAGSENLKLSGSTGNEAIKETGMINKSLFTLGAVISILSDISCDKKPPNAHVPFRNSALTKLLYDSMSGKGMSMMIANLSPAKQHQAVSLRTLYYASRARNIKLKPQIQNTADSRNKDDLISKLKRTIKELNEENFMLRQLLHQNNIPIPTSFNRPNLKSVPSMAALSPTSSPSHPPVSTNTWSLPPPAPSNEWQSATRTPPHHASPYSAAPHAQHAASEQPDFLASPEPLLHVLQRGDISNSPSTRFMNPAVREQHRLTRAQSSSKFVPSDESEAFAHHSSEDKLKIKQQAKQLKNASDSISQLREQLHSLQIQMETMQVNHAAELARKKHGSALSINTDTDDWPANSISPVRKSSQNGSDHSPARPAFSPKAGDIPLSPQMRKLRQAILNEPDQPFTSNYMAGAHIDELRYEHYCLKRDNNKLAKLVEMYENNDIKEKDMTDDYELLSPNKKKQLSEIFALKKSSSRLQKQISILKEHNRALEDSEKALTQEIARLRQQVDESGTQPQPQHVVVSQPTPSRAFTANQPPSSVSAPFSLGHASVNVKSPNTKSPNPKSPKSAVDLGPSSSAFSFPTDQRLAGGARPTLALAVPPPGQQPAAQKHEPPPHSSALISSASASINTSTPSSSVPSITSEQILSGQSSKSPIVSQRAHSTFIPTPEKVPNTDSSDQFPPADQPAPPDHQPAPPADPSIESSPAHLDLPPVVVSANSSARSSKSPAASNRSAKSTAKSGASSKATKPVKEIKPDTTPQQTVSNTSKAAVKPKSTAVNKASSKKEVSSTKKPSPSAQEQPPAQVQPVEPVVEPPVVDQSPPAPADTHLSASHREHELSRFSDLDTTELDTLDDLHSHRAPQESPIDLADNNDSVFVTQDPVDPIDSSDANTLDMDEYADDSSAAPPPVGVDGAATPDLAASSPPTPLRTPPALPSSRQHVEAADTHTDDPLHMDEPSVSYTDQFEIDDVDELDGASPPINHDDVQASNEQHTSNDEFPQDDGTEVEV